MVRLVELIHKAIMYEGPHGGATSTWAQPSQAEPWNEDASISAPASNSSLAVSIVLEAQVPYNCAMLRMSFTFTIELR